MNNFTYDKIPELLVDKNTYLEKNNPAWLPERHTQFTYLFCIIIRILIGLLILSDKMSPNIIIILCLLIIIMFGSKFLYIKSNKKSLWKNYLRTIISYTTILLIQKNNIKNKNQLSGLIVIVDALMGQQSRFITTNMSRNAPI